MAKRTTRAGRKAARTAKKTTARKTTARKAASTGKTTRRKGAGRTAAKAKTATRKTKTSAKKTATKRTTKTNRSTAKRRVARSFAVAAVPCVPGDQAGDIVFDAVGPDVNVETKLEDLFPDPEAREQFCQRVAEASGVPRPNVPCAGSNTLQDVIIGISC
jgi:hypothetical protein